MKKPMTTEEFFDRICEILKEKGMMHNAGGYSWGCMLWYLILLSAFVVLS